MIPPPPLGVSLAGLRLEPRKPWSGTARGAIEWAAAAGFRYVCLDGTAPGLRARELDRSARRDLAALLRRLGIECCGLDLLIPTGDFADAARSERAATATVGAIELAADLVSLGAAKGPLSVCLELSPQAGVDALTRIRDRASVCGVRVADLARPARKGRHAEDPIGVAIDPAALLLAGEDVASAASRAGSAVFAARLSDADSAGRVPVGHGRLDRTAYVVSLATAGYDSPLILDLRGLADQARAARETLEEWGGEEPGGEEVGR